MSWSEARAFYERHELKFAVGFFLGGFVFDVLTLSAIDDPWSILQQVAYLALLGGILFLDFLHHAEALTPPSGRLLGRLWDYRGLALHFLLGGLLSVYSLFFLKSASAFSSLVFVGVLLALLIWNESEAGQKSAVDVKVALYFVCVFCFFSLLAPILLGFVGWTPFLVSLLATLLCLWGAFHLARKRLGRELVLRRLVLPGGGAALVFVISFLFGWIPPVPLSVEKAGIYHKIEKEGDKYLLHHERPWWRFWHSGDQHFRAAPGDKIFFFASVFSPARFEDSVIVEWQYKDPRQGWQVSDRIPMRITGGREGGYRGFTTKQNFTEGAWTASVQTTDGRELTRISFDVEKLSEPPLERPLQVEAY